MCWHDWVAMGEQPYFVWGERSKKEREQKKERKVKLIYERRKKKFIWAKNVLLTTTKKEI